MRTCDACRDTKPEDEFPLCTGSNGKRRRRRKCKTCYKAMRAAYYQANRAKIGKKTNDWYHANRTAALARQKIAGRTYRQKLKQEVIVAYGGSCSCCKESDHRFLTLDHVNNDGNEHRKQLPAWQLYRWARDNGYPDTLQVACFNCNIGRHINGGTCPHQEVV